MTAVTEAADDGIVLYNIYDAGGERVLKTNNDNNVEITINGTIATPVAVDKLDDYVTYVNPYYVLRKDYFTTHFYIEGERVATKLSEEDKDLGLFFHHKDHLGSAAYTTGISSGETTQHIEYFPFGETFIDEKEDGRDEDAGKDNPYRYNSKELDQETGLYYYGARYYDPRTSVWQSVDPPILGKFLDGYHNNGVGNSKNLSVYSYTYQNPIRLIDPDGNQVDVNYMQNKGSDATIYNGAENVKNYPNSLQIVAHGNADYFRIVRNGQKVGGRPGEINGPITFDQAMKVDANDIWNNRENVDGGLTVIIYSCNTGSDDKVARSRSGHSVVRRISKGHPNHTFIAPDKYGWFSQKGLSGTFDKTAEGNINRETPGTWLMFKDGEIIGAYSGDWTPKPNPGWWDNLWYGADIPSGEINTNPTPNSDSNKKQKNKDDL